MKKLIPLLLLTTLVSCNDTIGYRSTITSNDSLVQRYSSSLTNERGVVANIQKQGTDFAVDFTKESGLLSTISINQKTTSVVVQIDGNKIYKYLVTQDLVNKTVRKRVVLENENTRQELQEILNSGKGVLRGDNLVMKFSEEMPASGNLEMELVRKDSIMADVNLWRPHCDSRSEITTSGQLILHGNVDSAKNIRMTEISVCGPKYSDKQLRALDLSSVEFCSYPDDGNEDCESDKDMSFLTADL